MFCFVQNGFSDHHAPIKAHAAETDVLPKSATRSAGLVVAAACIAVVASLITSIVVEKFPAFQLDDSFTDVSYDSFEVT